jgi:Fe-S-cluster-containing dehydrogenase component
MSRSRGSACTSCRTTRSSITARTSRPASAARRVTAASTRCRSSRWPSRCRWAGASTVTATRSPSCARGPDHQHGLGLREGRQGLRRLQGSRPHAPGPPAGALLGVPPLAARVSRMSKPTESLKHYWRSLEDATGRMQRRPPTSSPASRRRRPIPRSSRSPRLARRKFNGLLGASTALAGLTTTGCLRKPVEHILPFAKRPEDTIPGQAGLLRDGLPGRSQRARPARRVAGRPPDQGRGQPASPELERRDRRVGPGLGALALRPRPLPRPAPARRTASTSRPTGTPSEELGATLKSCATGRARASRWSCRRSPRRPTATCSSSSSEKFARPASSPTTSPPLDQRGRRRRAAGRRAGPRDLPPVRRQGDRGVRRRHLPEPAGPRPPPARVRRGPPHRQPRRRRQHEPALRVEPHFTTTGAQADHRLRVRAAQVGRSSPPSPASCSPPTSCARPQRRGPARRPAEGRARRRRRKKFATALTNDLIAAKGARATSAVIVGERQPAWVHALGLLVNYALGNGGNTVRLRYDDQAFKSEDIAALAKGLADGSITQVIASRPTRPTTPPASSAWPSCSRASCWSTTARTWTRPASWRPGACPPPLPRVVGRRGGRRLDDLARPAAHRPAARQLEQPRQWGMVIDLNTCTGCNACIVACQAENNIPVGRQGPGPPRPRDALDPHRPLLHRARGAPEACRPAHACQHCETAPARTSARWRRPCTAPRASTTWPTTAASAPGTAPTTARSRCALQLLQLQQGATTTSSSTWQKNPDVTVRFRGVMEKCTYCVQRIQPRPRSRRQHRAGEDLVKDGAIVPPASRCAPQCHHLRRHPDKDSRVSKAQGPQP